MGQPCEHLKAAFEYLIRGGYTFQEKKSWGKITLLLETDHPVDWKAVWTQFPLIQPVGEYFEQDPRWPREGLICREHHHLIVAPDRNQP